MLDVELQSIDVEFCFLKEWTLEIMGLNSLIFIILVLNSGFKMFDGDKELVFKDKISRNRVY